MPVIKQNQIVTKHILLLISVFLISLFYITNTQAVVPPEDPGQSITYWKSNIISAKKDLLVSQAQNVFSVLLRAWDSARIEPTLYVVDSTAGPWAASLADGNILMSRDAIITVQKFGQQRANHLLAFILAHELAHQRSDDLWHQRFFRLIGNQNSSSKKQLLNGLQINRQLFDNVAEKEIQADRDGLLMMNSVGYDPFQVLDTMNNDDFFTKWVENIWKDSCDIKNTNSDILNICGQARSRALRARIQLTNLATQSILYDLGVQAFAANDFINARRYFTAYGRDNTNRTVLSAIGLSYFAEAITYKKQLIHKYQLNQADFYYPFLLDASNNIITNLQTSKVVKRSSYASVIKTTNIKMNEKLDESIRYFEKAIRLEPNHAKTYLLLAFSYLLKNNTFMVRGVIQGKYLPKFGKDPATDLILAMTNSIEGNHEKSAQMFEQLIIFLNKKEQSQSKSMSFETLLYSAYHNSTAQAVFDGKPEKATKQWQEFAKITRQSGRSMLFQMALKQLKPDKQYITQLLNAPTINGKQLDDNFSVKDLTRQQYKINNLLLEGELYHVYRLENGSRYVIGPNQKIISAWQDFGSLYLNGIKKAQLSLFETSDRPFKKFGIPDRGLHMMSGDYLAYDKYGLAIHVVQNKITGWFLYHAN
ncbi:MAG: hypothetical protein ACC657_11415 [Thiohalomonadales bacterium]